MTAPRSGDPRLIAVMGTTASGKTSLVESLADEMGAVLINGDAFQIYRGMDIGTGKSSTPDRYALMNIRNPDQTYGVGEFVLEALAVLATAHSDGKDAIVVGGTGLYIRALFENYADLAEMPSPELRARLNETPLEELLVELKERDPSSFESIDLKNPIRVKRAIERTFAERRTVPPNPYVLQLKIALDRDLEVLREAIAHRTSLMVQNGWIEEVERLESAGYGQNDPGFRAIGYRTMSKYRAGEIPLDVAMETTIVETVRYAKRQKTWLRTEKNLTILDGGKDAVSEARQAISAMYC